VLSWAVLVGLAGCRTVTPSVNSDSGTLSSDAGSPDGGSPDGGSPDSGSTDGGTLDGGTMIPASVLLNELMADNESSVSDDAGVFSDWLELYNPGDSDLDLSGFGVSDDWTNPFQAVLPEGTSLAARGYLLLWADASQKPTVDHLPFRLNASGEGVGVFSPKGEALDWVVYQPLATDVALARLPDGSDNWETMPFGTPGATNQRLETVQEEVVSSGATWAYWDGADSPGDGWNERGFDDSAWATGPAPLGYGDPVSTVISYGGNSSAKYQTAWFRTTFDIPSGKGDLSGATLSVRFDDGTALYIDGVEVGRLNLPAGELTADTLATVTVYGTAEKTYTQVDIDAMSLAEGRAVLAAEVHQAAVTSSDLTLDAVLTVKRLEPVR